MKKLILAIVTVFFISGVQNNCKAQVKKDTLKVLFVGNSYTYSNNLPQIVSIISNKTNTKLITKKSTIGGAKLSQHWNGERGLKTKEIIAKGNFDIVVLQGHSMSTIKESDSLLKYSKLFCDFVKSNEAKPYLFVTWAREFVPQYQETINNGYNQISQENNVIEVPVGNAWALAQKLRPTIKLFSGDGTHPSDFGTFLTACVFVNVLTNELPEKVHNEFRIKDLNGEEIQLMYIDNLNEIFLKKVAQKVVEEM